MKKIWIISSLSIIILMAFQLNESSLKLDSYNESSNVYDVLKALGDKSVVHESQFTEEQVKEGEELVKLGRTRRNGEGKKTAYISKHYVCTSCHNLEKEDPDLKYSNPETRLEYVKKKGIPFLQGTTFKGIVNRESWYNDDYIKKYGDEKIEIAHKNLRESIQLCAIECSQGRKMKDWEIESVLAYYWTLQFTLRDLGFNKSDYQKLNKEKTGTNKQADLVTWIRSFYLQKSPAHFYDAPVDKQAGYSEFIGNPSKGKDLYELSCLHCHKNGGVSHYVLDNNDLSFKDMKRTMFKNSHFSLYQIIPYGTYAIPGHKPYMPHYPMERMNKQQVEDLRSYIEFRVENYKL